MNEIAADAQGHRRAEGTAHGAVAPLETLAQAIAGLSADDRAKLAAMLAQGIGERGGNP